MDYFWGAGHFHAGYLKIGFSLKFAGRCESHSIPSSETHSKTRFPLCICDVGNMPVTTMWLAVSHFIWKSGAPSRSMTSNAFSPKIYRFSNATLNFHHIVMLPRLVRRFPHLIKVQSQIIVLVHG